MTILNVTHQGVLCHHNVITTAARVFRLLILLHVYYCWVSTLCYLLSKVQPEHFSLASRSERYFAIDLAASKTDVSQVLTWTAHSRRSDSNERIQQARSRVMIALSKVRIYVASYSPLSLGGFIRIQAAITRTSAYPDTAVHR